MASASAEIERGPGAALVWLVLVVSLALAAAWLWYSTQLIPINVEGLAPRTALFYLLVFGPIMAIGVGCGLISRQPVLRTGQRPLLWLALGLVAGVIGIGGTIGFAWLAGVVTAAPLPAGTDIALVALGLAITLFQTTAEEAMFRGWIQPGLVARIGATGGVTLTALVFAGFHAIVATWDPVSLFNMLLGGLLFGLLALRSGGLLAPIGAHFAWNAIEDNVLGLVPNPGIGDLGALRNLELVGAPIWGGGADGLNASIGTSVILIALCLPLLLRADRAAGVPVRSGLA